jgi:hypothetical protein
MSQLYTRKNTNFPKNSPGIFLFEKTINFVRKKKEKPHDAKPICMEPMYMKQEA